MFGALNRTDCVVNVVLEQWNRWGTAVMTNECLWIKVIFSRCGLFSYNHASHYVLSFTLTFFFFFQCSNQTLLFWHTIAMTWGNILLSLLTICSFGTLHGSPHKNPPALMLTKKFHNAWRTCINSTTWTETFTGRFFFFIVNVTLSCLCANNTCSMR